MSVAVAILSVPPYFGVWPDRVVATGLVVVVGDADVDAVGCDVDVGGELDFEQATSKTPITSVNDNNAKSDFLIFCLLFSIFGT